MANHQIARVFREGTLVGVSDRELLEQYLLRRDELAFEAIVARHGPMVWNVCRRRLHDAGDIEDAFQATFLALIRLAGSIRVDQSLGPWLHAVAGRIAMRARNKRQDIRTLEQVPHSLPDRASADAGHGDNARILHEELARLPERLRAPIVLCYLEGLTHDLAANELSCPVGTIHSRLARARSVLHGRLLRRGLSLSTGALALLLESNVHGGSVPPRLVSELLKEAARSLSGTILKTSTVGVGVSASAVMLMEGVVNVMRIKTLSVVTAGLVSATAVIALVIPAAWSEASPPSNQTVLAANGEPVAKPAEQRKETFPRTYPVGDLILPPRGQNTPGHRSVAVTMMPLIKLITSVIEPGSWRVFDDRGRDVTNEHRPIGANSTYEESVYPYSITPFLLSISLIIRADDETHAKISTLFQGMRLIADARERHISHVEFVKDEGSPYDHSPPAPPAPAPAASTLRPRAAQPKPQGSRRKMERLLDELRQELSNLPEGPGR